VVVSAWAGRRVFVTGATGLLGSWLTRELIEEGADVVCLVRDWVPASELVRSGGLERATAVRGELEDHALLVRALNEYEIDSVFHIGAQTIVGTSSRSPLSTFESNVRGTWNLLEACRQNARLVERVVVASSDKAYGDQPVLPYTEETPLQGRYPYDVSKSCTDLIALSYFHSFGLPVAVTRCGNLFGGGDLNFNRLVPGTIRSALLGESPIIRSDGTFVREYFYVKDAVRAYLDLAARLPDEAFHGQAWNFGNEVPLTVLELVERILGVMGSKVDPTVLGEASNEIQAQTLDCTKAHERLGWTPRWSLDDALSETVDWYRAWLTR
jgi:CDP-glucose 4,6-dehydratase